MSDCLSTQPRAQQVAELEASLIRDGLEAFIHPTVPTEEAIATLRKMLFLGPQRLLRHIEANAAQSPWLKGNVLALAALWRRPDIGPHICYYIENGSTSSSYEQRLLEISLHSKGNPGPCMLENLPDDGTWIMPPEFTDIQQREAGIISQPPEGYNHNTSWYNALHQISHGLYDLASTSQISGVDFDLVMGCYRGRGNIVMRLLEAYGFALRPENPSWAGGAWIANPSQNVTFRRGMSQ